MIKINSTCYTIGHSKHTTEQFAGLVKPYGIDLVIDVRSIPYSRHAPQFNRTIVEQRFNQFNLEYEYMGDVMGGKFSGVDYLNESGYIDFYKVIKNETFQEGINLVVLKIHSGLRVALMCAEKDPLYCHRFLLISRELISRGIRVVHLLADGNAIDNKELLNNTAIGKKQDNAIQMDLFTDVKNTNVALCADHIQIEGTAYIKGHPCLEENKPILDRQCVLCYF